MMQWCDFRDFLYVLLFFFGLTRGYGLFRAVKASWDFPVRGRASSSNFVVFLKFCLASDERQIVIFFIFRLFVIILHHKTFHASFANWSHQFYFQVEGEL